MTEHFIQTISVLLELYIADAKNLIHLLKIPQYFDVEIYLSSREETVIFDDFNILSL